MQRHGGSGGAVRAGGRGRRGGGGGGGGGRGAGGSQGGASYLRPSFFEDPWNPLLRAGEPRMHPLAFGSARAAAAFTPAAPACSAAPMGEKAPPQAGRALVLGGDLASAMSQLQALVAQPMDSATEVAVAALVRCACESIQYELGQAEPSSPSDVDDASERGVEMDEDALALGPQPAPPPQPVAPPRQRLTLPPPRGEQ